MRKLLVTGALGHIGSGLIRDLPREICGAVSLLDNLSTQRFPSLFGLPDGLAFQFREADIRTVDLDPLIEGVDAVIHLAAVTNAAASFGNAAEVEEINFEGTRRVAEACVRHGCRLVFPSTTSVYGTQKALVDEDCGVEELKPQSPYAGSKLKAERMLSGMRGLRFVTLRFGTIFGVSPGMRFHTAVNKFIWDACLGRPLTVWRTAMDQKRPYLDLRDAVAAMVFVLERDLFEGGLYNVVSANATVGEILAVLRRHAPGLSVELVDSPIMNQLSYEVSNARFRGLGFEFRGDLERGIRETFELLGGWRVR